MNREELMRWLLSGDVAIQYHTQRDLLHAAPAELDALQSRIALEGWGAAYLEQRRPGGFWGRSYYQPKWTSTHYTLLELKNLGFPPQHPLIQSSLQKIFLENKAADGGINPIGTVKVSDVCINGMVLNFGTYFGVPAADLESVVDFLLAEWMPDGGFNCRSNRKGAVHSSLHSTLSVIEGIHEYQAHGYQYRLPELLAALRSSQEFILVHRLFQSHRTGAVIDAKMLRLAYPTRWRYDILRALEAFRICAAPYDERMQPALDIVLQKRRPDGSWRLAAAYPGEVYFNMEKAGQPSRWNTLRALRVLEYYNLASL